MQPIIQQDNQDSQLSIDTLLKFLSEWTGQEIN
jgi:hypothetical protein